MLHKASRAALLVLALQGTGTAWAAERVFSADQIMTALFGATRAINPRERSTVNLPTVTFEFNSDRLTDQGKRQLDELAKALATPGLSDRRVTIGGHTDGKGKPDYNKQLSARRAEAARAYLVEEHGLPGEMSEAVGFGMSRLLKDRPRTAPEQRRVEVSIEPAG